MSKDENVRLHKESVIIDGLNASYLFNEDVLRRLKEGGITAINSTVAAWHSLPETMNFIADYYNLFEQYADTIMPVREVADIVALPGMLTGQDSASLNDYIDVIDYLVDLIGVNHVGLGPDFMEEVPDEVIAPSLKGISPSDREKFYSSTIVDGFESISRCPAVTSALLERGYKPQDVKKIIGENWLRLYGEVWK